MSVRYRSVMSVGFSAITMSKPPDEVEGYHNSFGPGGTEIVETSSSGRGS
jgi:hypothetical protein